MFMYAFSVVWNFYWHNLNLPTRFKINKHRASLAVDDDVRNWKHFIDKKPFCHNYPIESALIHDTACSKGFGFPIKAEEYFMTC